MNDVIVKAANRFYLLSTAQTPSVNARLMKNVYEDISNLMRYTDRDVALAVDAFSNGQLTLVRNHLGDFDRTLEQIAGSCYYFISGMKKTAGFFDFLKRKPKEEKIEETFEEKHRKAISSFRIGIWNTINNSKLTLNKIKAILNGLKSSLEDDISFSNQIASLREICINHHKMLQDANKEYFLPLLNIKSTVEYQGNYPVEPSDYEIPEKFEPAGVPFQVGRNVPLDVKLKQEHKEYAPGLSKEYRFSPCPCGSGKAFVGCHGENFDRIKEIILRNKEKELLAKFDDDRVADIMKQYRREDNEFWTEAEQGSKEQKEFEKAEREYFRFLNAQAAKEAAKEAEKEEQKRQETIAIRKDRRNRLKDFYESVFGKKKAV